MSLHESFAPDREQKTRNYNALTVNEVWLMTDAGGSESSSIKKLCMIVPRMYMRIMHVFVLCFT